MWAVPKEKRQKQTLDRTRRYSLEEAPGFAGLNERELKNKIGGLRYIGKTHF
jgi:hypothetical protein